MTIIVEGSSLHKKMLFLSIPIVIFHSYSNSTKMDSTEKKYTVKTKNTS